MMIAMEVCSIQYTFPAFALFASHMLDLSFVLSLEQLEPTSFILVFASIYPLFGTAFNAFPCFFFFVFSFAVVKTNPTRILN